MDLTNTLPKSHPNAPAVDDRDDRRTVIPAPKRDGMFGGWGVRF